MLDYLAAGASPAGAELMSFLPIIGMILIFWFLLFRPQMKQAKEHREKVAAVKRNDQIVTAGGVVGKVTKVDDDYIEVEIAKDTRVKVVKATISNIIQPGGKPAND